ncbi:FliH/SctL family protein [Qipengyuania sp.]|jgi:flagellar assembly protein FliH|uniref:FliH/SctL family protein n=1 Tax=Qipengyuania sp. TaxID=2004515 RepID=UPI003AF5A57D
MSRVAYSALGRRGSFSRNSRFTTPEAPSAPPAEIEDAAEKAYRAGYEDGQISARADFDAQLKAERAARAAIELAFARFDAESERNLRDGLLATVHALCEEALLPLALDAEGLARRVDAAAAMLKRKHDRRIIHIHPDDLELVRDSVAADLELVPDGSVERGGLRVETEDGGVEDGPQQWHRALAEIFDTCRT